MPVPADQAIVPRRLQLSGRALVLGCVCLAATALGASAVAVSFSLVLATRAGSPAYWSVAALLLVLWLATLINMYRLALAAIPVER